MNDEERVALIYAEIAILNLDVAAMIAENQFRVSCGNALAYGDEQFDAVRSAFEGKIIELAKR